MVVPFISIDSTDDFIVFVSSGLRGKKITYLQTINKEE